MPELYRLSGCKRSGAECPRQEEHGRKASFQRERQDTRSTTDLHEIDDCEPVLYIGAGVGDSKIEPLRVLGGVEIMAHPQVVRILVTEPRWKKNNDNKSISTKQALEKTSCGCLGKHFLCDANRVVAVCVNITK